MNFRTAIGAQVPPRAVGGRLSFAGRRFSVGRILLLRLFGLSGAWLGRAAFDLAHFFAAGVGDGQLGHVLLSQIGLEIEIKGRAVLRIFSRRGVVRDRRRLRYFLEAILLAQLKEIRLARADLPRDLLERV